MNRPWAVAAVAAICMTFSACICSPPGLKGSAAGAGVASAPFGVVDGREVRLFTLTNAHGMTVKVSTYGAIIQSLTAPDRAGRFADVVLGYNTVAEYVKDTPYFGAIVGRYGNRIANGKFTLDGAEYTLATNNVPGGMPCSLHGGIKGFDKVVWDAVPVRAKDKSGVRLHYLSKDGEEGFPGNLDITVTYWLTAENDLEIDYLAATDKATPVNVTQHSYFNLKGEGNGDILGHELLIAADKFTPVTQGLIPTGQLRPVKGTPFDFTAPHRIGERIGDEDEQLTFGGGYDHNWVLNAPGGAMALAARVHEPESGRVLEVWTREPGLQFYCGNFLDGHLVGKSGKPYPYRSGFCLETQHYPDSPNQPGFPSCILRPGQKYQTRTVFKFRTIRTGKISAD